MIFVEFGVFSHSMNRDPNRQPDTINLCDLDLQETHQDRGRSTIGCPVILRRRQVRISASAVAARWSA